MIEPRKKAISESTWHDTSFVSMLTKSGSLPIITVRCNDKKNGKRCFFVMRFANQSGPDKLSRASKQAETINLADYGEILIKGFGENPSEEDMAELKAKYSIDYKEIFS